jgi:hypothetical protein
VCITTAVLFGLCGAVLMATDIPARYDGESVSCGSVILVAAVPTTEAPAANAAEAARQQHVAAACGDARMRVTVLTGLAVLVCVGLGSVAAFRGRPITAP